MALHSRPAGIYYGAHYGTRSKGMRSSFQPGTSFDSFVRNVGSQLSNTSLVEALSLGFTGTNLCFQNASFQTANMDILNGKNCSIQNLSSDKSSSSTGTVDTLIANSIYINRVNSKTLMMLQMTGDTLNTANIYNDRGKFTSLNVNDYNFPYTATLSNLVSTNCITGNNVYLESMSFDKVFSSMSGNSLIAKYITGSYMNMSSYITDTVEGLSAFITDTYTSNFSSQMLNANITASSAFFTTITGSNIFVTNVSVPSITGTSAWFANITGENFYGNMSVTSMSGTDAFITNGIITNGLITSGSLSTYSVFSPITVNDLVSETINLKGSSVNVINPISSSPANMGGDLPDTAYMFHVSDDMKCIASYNTQYNSMWNGTHYITSDGGNIWYPCTGSGGYNMNGGICVSRDGMFWIGTRTSSGNDGGIYKSTDGVTFNQVLSVISSGSTFQCCDISEDNTAVLVCTDSSPSNYTIPFYISLNGGETWKTVIPSTTLDHYWISDTAISKDGKYMIVLDRNGIFISVDYGNTWKCNGCPLAGYNKQVAMSKNGSHMYVSGVLNTFQISTDFGQTWENKPPTQDSYSGVDCDGTGRYVFLTISGKSGFLVSNNYGNSFISFKGVSGNADDINTSTDGSKIMVYDGRALRFNTFRRSDTKDNGKLIVNGKLNIKTNIQRIPSLSIDNISLGKGRIAGVKMNNSSIFCQGLQKLKTSKTLTIRAVSNWTSITTPKDAHWTRSCWSPELHLFCTISNSNKVIVSSDGKNWVLVIVPTSEVKDICWSSEKELFVVVGSRGSMHSKDGNMWASSFSSIVANAVCYAPEIGIFCAIGNKSFTSTDGIIWTSGSSFSSSAKDVCWSGDLGIFCSSDGYISTNGRTWTNGGKPYAEICWAPDLNLFCCVGTNVIATSSNGTKWTTTSFSGNWNGVSWSPELQVLICVSNSGFAYSFDGLTWYPIRIPEGNWSGLCWSKELGIFVASSKNVIISRYVKKFSF